MGNWERIFEDLYARLDGPLHFRFIAQPLIAVTFAILDGIKDAQAGKPAYFWTLVFSPGHRKDLIKGGWKSVGKVLIMALILDMIYQLIVHHTIYPGETLIVAFTLVIVPYLVLRGPVNRLVQLWRKVMNASAPMKTRN